MSTPVSVLPPGVVNATAVPATAKVPGSSRAQAAAGPLTLQTDVMQFPGPQITGNWIVGSSRVTVNAIPIITQASTGTSVGPSPVPPGPMTVILGDPRIMAV